MAIVNKINAILGKQLPVITIFESGGTISGLAEKVFARRRLRKLGKEWGRTCTHHVSAFRRETIDTSRDLYQQNN